MPRIIQVVQEFSTEGGVETVAFELQREWVSAGVASRVLASVVPDRAHTGCVDRVAPWLDRVPTRGMMRYAGRLAVVPAFTLAATAAIRRQPRDTVVLSHGDSLAGDVLVIHAVNKASLVEKRRAGSRRHLLNPMHAWVAARDRRMIGGLRFRRYVAVSGRVAGELAEHYAVPPERISTIPNGINLARFGRGPSGIRAEFGIPEAAPLLLFVGHEFERKGLSFVVDALARLDRETRLLVVGSDNQDRYRRQAAELGVGDRLLFAGARRDMPDFYRASDAFVFPTNYESFSLVCMEALACGVPIFATAVGGIEEYLVDGLNGATITRDGPDIAARLAPVLADPARLAALRDGAVATASRFGWPAIAGRYAELLGEVWREREAGQATSSRA